MISYTTFLCTKDPWEAIVERIFKGWIHVLVFQVAEGIQK